ncbi:MAG TPA: hypothetical protein VKV17_16095 [Bryobacteraceae bacterium]|nr:hypothetical protein [Bryobacteraceae bacterium]
MRGEVLNLVRQHEAAEETKSFLNQPLVHLSFSLAAGDVIAGRYQVAGPGRNGGSL